MSTQCVFCKIVQNKVVGSIVYEDDRVMSFLDFRPVAKGHTLVITKKHYENIYEIPNDEIAYLFRVVKRIALAVKGGVKADGIKIIQNNGKAADQVVFHFHVHIIPRYENQQSFQPRIVVCENSLSEVAQKIRQVFS